MLTERGRQRMGKVEKRRVRKIQEWKGAKVKKDTNKDQKREEEQERRKREEERGRQRKRKTKFDLVSFFKWWRPLL